MKKSVLCIPFIFSFILFTGGCSYKNDASSNINLIQNQAQKEEAYNQILQNENLFNDFMQQMAGRPRSMEWMMQDPSVMNRMFTTENFSYMMNHNPELHQQMMTNMMYMFQNDSSYYQQWNSMMQNQHNMGGMMMH
ncbi:MAG TPA: hypothetical protein VE870_05905 [Bacteroidales bacterium]|nr:hypothetical protein [Bacteroidales bacterium]